MAENRVTRSQGEQAADVFTGMFESEINDNERFNEEGQLIRLNTPEADQLTQRYTGIVQSLPSVVERSTFRNRVAQMLYNARGSDREYTRVLNLANRLDGAFQTSLLPSGVKLDQQQAQRAATGFDLSTVTTPAQAAEVLRAIVATHLADNTGFNVNEAAGSANAQYNGERVRLTRPETNRIMSLMDELFARMQSPQDVTALRAAGAELLTQAPNDGYERNVKFRELTNHFEAAYQRSLVR